MRTIKSFTKDLQVVGIMIKETPDFITVICNHPVQTFEFLAKEIQGFSINQFPVTYTGYKFYEDGNWLGNPSVFVTFVPEAPQAVLNALSWISNINVPYIESAV